MKVAFLGAGAMCREHAKAFADIEGVILQGVAGRSPENASAFAKDFHIPIVCSSPVELYSQTQADLVIIAVTDDQATKVALAALKHPWAVFMEKPPGLDCNETNQLRKAALGREEPFYVGLNRRFIGSTLDVQSEMSVVCGPRHIMVQDQEDLGIAASFGYSRRILDQWMFANSIHMIDYISVFARGKLDEVRIIQPWKAENPDIVSAFIRFDSGDTALYEALWNRPGPWAVSVTTDQDRWELRPLERARKQSRGSRLWTDLPPHVWDSEFKPGFRRQAQEIINGINKLPSNAATLEQSYLSMQLVESIYVPSVTT